MDNAAYRLEELEERIPRRTLRVHEGGRSQQQPRTEQAIDLKPVWRMLFIVGFCLAAISAVRVNLVATTVSSLSDLTEAQENVDSARDLRASLRVERSVAASVDRIKRIATENYSMEFASTAETIQVHLASADEAATDADAS
jgi:cell division protein FtsL